jgi:hypothetical protein
MARVARGKSGVVVRRTVFEREADEWAGGEAKRCRDGRRVGQMKKLKEWLDSLTQERDSLSLSMIQARATAEGICCCIQSERPTTVGAW